MFVNILVAGSFVVLSLPDSQEGLTYYTPVICNHCPNPQLQVGWGTAGLRCRAITFDCPLTQCREVPWGELYLEHYL